MSQDSSSSGTVATSVHATDWKKKYTALRDELAGIDVTQLVQATDKNHFFFDSDEKKGSEGGVKRSGESSAGGGEGMKDLNVEVLKQLRLKIVNYVLS